MNPDAAATLDARAYYDARYAAGWLHQWPRYKQERMAALLLGIGLEVRARVLEFGCGRGIFAQALKARRPDLEVHGCDISAEAIRQGRERFADISFHLLSGDTEPPWGRFDLIYSHHVLEHVADLDAAIAQIARLLRPAGKMLHVLPCANPGSLESRLSALARNGEARDAAGRFCCADSSHLRHLSSRELETVCRAHGFRLRRAWFANQFWGGLDYLTGEHYSKLAEWFYPRRQGGSSRRPRLAAWFFPLLALCLARQTPGYLLRACRARRRPAKRALFCALLPLAVLGWPFSWVLGRGMEFLREHEWRTRSQQINGGEMYLLFER